MGYHFTIEIKRASSESLVAIKPKTKTKRISNSNQAKMNAKAHKTFKTYLNEDYRQP